MFEPKRDQLSMSLRTRQPHFTLTTNGQMRQPDSLQFGEEVQGCIGVEGTILTIWFEVTAHGGNLKRVIFDTYNGDERDRFALGQPLIPSQYVAFELSRYGSLEVPSQVRDLLDDHGVRLPF